MPRCGTVGQVNTTTRPVVALDVDGVLNPNLTTEAQLWLEEHGVPAPGAVQQRDTAAGRAWSRRCPQIPALPGYEVYQVWVPAAELPDSPFLRGRGEQDLSTLVQLSTRDADRLAALTQRADLVWATTWEGAANTVLAPLLALGDLELGVSVEVTYPRFGYVRNGDVAAWKAEALAERYTGRPLVWLDDLAWAYHPQVPSPWADQPVPGPDAEEWERRDYEEMVAYYEEERWRAEPTLVVKVDPARGVTEALWDAVTEFVTTHS